MKKILSLTALALIGLVSYAYAGPLVAPHLVHKSLMFRTHIAAPTAAQLALPNSAYDAMGFYVDSLATQKAAGFDTTAGISTAGWADRPAANATDSVVVLALRFSDAGNSATGADSLFVQAQVSNDGKNWSPVAASL
jgi:hypothetical protein